MKIKNFVSRVGLFALLPAQLSPLFGSQNVSLDEALKYASEGGAVIIRQVTSMDRKLEVRERMKNRYAHKKYPDEFPFRYIDCS